MKYSDNIVPPLSFLDEPEGADLNTDAVADAMTMVFFNENLHKL